jgi:hypothetical protein
VTDKKKYKAVKKVFLDEDRYVQMNLSFKAIDEEDAQRFLEQDEYKGYELVGEE